MDIPVLLAHLPLQFRFFAKKGLFLIPIMGTHLRRAGHLPVVKGDPRASLRSMSDGAKLIRERGLSVLLFPEGGRSTDSLQDFKEGAAYVAIKAGVPVIPIAMTGTREVLPMGSMQIMSGIVELKIGDPISIENLTLKDRLPLTGMLRDKVAGLLASSAAKA
jgi:1-acyl-sn-glycerol-3-phosphate acyltransferase